MKILHIITGLRTGGAEMMLLRLATMSGPDAVHEVISLRGMGTVGARLRQAGVRVTTIDMFGMSAPIAFIRLVAAVRRCRPDLVQTWLYHADVIGGMAARLAGVRTIVWGVRTADIRVGISLSRSAGKMLELGAKLSRLLPSCIVYVAEAARVVHEAAGYHPSKSAVIQNGFTLPDPAELAAARRAVRYEIGVPEGALLIGTAGTFTPQKNQIGLVAACAPLLAARPDLHLALVGRGNDGTNPVLMEAVSATGYAERIHLLGERSDMAACLSAMDLFCLASRGEGFPNVVGEAMAVATPVLVTDVGDAALLAGDAGSVIPPDDAAALSGGLAALAQLPRSALKERGEKARKRIAEQFTMTQVKDRYLMLYRKLLAGKEHG